MTRINNLFKKYDIYIMITLVLLAPWIYVSSIQKELVKKDQLIQKQDIALIQLQDTISKQGEDIQKFLDHQGIIVKDINQELVSLHQTRHPKRTILNLSLPGNCREEVLEFQKLSVSLMESIR